MSVMTFFKPLIAVCLLLLAGGCVSPRPQEGARPARPAIARIEARGVLLVGSTGDYRPLTWRDPETGRWEGFGIEVAERIAARLGVRAEFVQTSWPTLAADVQADPPVFDLAIGGITVTDARRETMDMSEAAALAGTADVMVTEIVEAPWYVRNDPRLAAPLLAEPFTHGEIGVLLRKGQDDLLAFVNAALAEMAADGTLDSLKAKHGLAPRPARRRLQGPQGPRHGARPLRMPRVLPQRRPRNGGGVRIALTVRSAASFERGTPTGRRPSRESTRGDMKRRARPPHRRADVPPGCRAT